VLLRVLGSPCGPDGATPLTLIGVLTWPQPRSAGPFAMVAGSVRPGWTATGLKCITFRLIYTHGIHHGRDYSLIVVIDGKITMCELVLGQYQERAHCCMCAG